LREFPPAVGESPHRRAQAGEKNGAEGCARWRHVFCDFAWRAGHYTPILSRRRIKQMISVNAYRYLRLLLELAVFAAVTLAVLALLSLANAQTRVPRTAPPTGTPQTAFPAAQLEEPVYREYRGVQIGMTAAEARQKLGTPSVSNERQDFFVFSSAESAQVFYDAQKRVMAVSVNYLGEGAGAPTAEKVFGTPAETRPDGSAYRMVRYQHAGYFVVYTRTAGNAPPLVTVTMRKIID
jgi:hypothetical protein